MKTFASTLLLAPAVVLALSTGAAYAQQSSSAATGTTSQEMRRGAAGTDVDVGKDAQNKGGLPGVDVDVGRDRAAGADTGTRASGAAAADSTLAERRTVRADRN